MARGAMRERWQRTASLMAVLINVNRARNQDPVKPADLIPKHLLDKGDVPELPVVPVSVLADILAPRKD